MLCLQGEVYLAAAAVVLGHLDAGHLHHAQAGNAAVGLGVLVLCDGYAECD